jgi:hypothetical protein
MLIKSVDKLGQAILKRLEWKMKGGYALRMRPWYNLRGNNGNMAPLTRYGLSD